jgi:hypothetical protein
MLEFVSHRKPPFEEPHAPGSTAGVVLKPLQPARASVMWSNNETGSIGTSCREGFARVLDRDRVHVPAVIVRPYLDDGSVERGHAIRVVEVYDRQGDGRAIPHVLRLPSVIRRAHQQEVAFEINPDDVVPG